ncbi:type III-A CRISPR-associated RAMP protein Csm3 [Leucothrix pacifica]|uniref:CRISPR system Cms endoribonuclease Csm3 n=1 Tax=Leucothrix pacifica TaxID=1247513 RepID=A0A317CH21_9GAMM|nr:type III-A CRISPR-associated RAMP protein Csm3 [Leucothrix pacifica]PWQ97649.1 type III-A CRISPR-associated RAMP protein Csm3 [Leucothrix pacifica]
MKLNAVNKISGKIKLLTGLHIGSGDAEMHIGGTDSPVIKNPFTQEPYIPGSSIKGKMRSLLEWELGVVGTTDGKPLTFEHLEKVHNAQLEGAKNILKLFGGAPQPNLSDDVLKEIGPTRLAFWDCGLDREWVSEMGKRNLLMTEVKMETSIDRISGTAANGSLRNTERVPAGAIFEFNVSMRVHDDEALEHTLLRGLKLLELTGLGGSGSRGYGKVSISLDDPELQQRLADFDLQAA